MRWIYVGNTNVFGIYRYDNIDSALQNFELAYRFFINTKMIKKYEKNMSIEI